MASNVSRLPAVVAKTAAAKRDEAGVAASPAASSGLGQVRDAASVLRQVTETMMAEFFR